MVQKRNDYEHKVLAPGNKDSEWSSYAQWENSLESLRSKRCRRLKIRHLNSGHAGQGRVLAIYERGVGRHPGSSALWREYLEYTAHVKASKRWRKTMTNALRMMPTDVELWTMAGRRSAKNGDMAAARGFFMRGCRFCTKDCKLWIEYARCEMEWLDKMERRKSKGDKSAIEPKKNEGDDEILMGDSDDDDEEEEAENGLILPEPTMAQAKVIDKQASKQLASNPAMDGAIPIAIFNISRKQGFFKAEVAELFFEMFVSFSALPVQERISAHVLDVLNAEYPSSAVTANCHIRKPILGFGPNTAEFARGLRDVIPLLDKYMDETTEKDILKRKTIAWVDGYLKMEGLDEGIKKALEYIKDLYCGST